MQIYSEASLLDHEEVATQLSGGKAKMCPKVLWHIVWLSSLGSILPEPSVVELLVTNTSGDRESKSISTVPLNQP